MIFDFDKFGQIAASVYPQSPYSFEESMSIFRCYFERYERHTGRAHPPIKASQIMRICQIMPSIDGVIRGSDYADIYAADYPALIDRHFVTKYRNCDYNICHFFSGRIRELRFYEVFY